MKKIAFYLSAFVAVCALSFSSCTKEEVNPVEDNPTVIEQADDLFQIIGTIKDGALTKTQYTESAGTYRFSWSTDPGNNLYDEIGLLVKKNNSEVSWYRLFADNAASSTTFSGSSTIGDNATGDWSQTGFAIYPVAINTYGSRTGIDRKDKLTYGSTLNNGSVTVTLSASYDLGVDPDMNTQLSCTPLVGNKVGETNEYEFKTAVGVLMITLEGVPTTATGLRITSPSTDAPLSGTFNLDVGSPDIAMTNKVTGGQSRTVNFTVTEAGPKTFFIPVPVGTIPLVGGKGLQIELLDGTDTPIFSRRYTKELTITRNTIIPVPMNKWKKLGTGKFIDNHLWGKMNFGTNTFDEVGAVNVDIYQSITDATQYRIPDPYGQAAAFLAAEGQSQDTHDDYLYFSVSDSGVSFTDHLTGFNVSGENVTIKFIDGGTGTKLVAGTVASPEIVQLAPQYKGTGSFQESRYNDENRIVILFPGAINGYTGSCSILDNKADLSSGIAYTKGSSANRVIIQISDKPIYYYYAQGGLGPGSKVTEYDSNTVAAKSLGYGASGSNYDQTQSGVKYLIWSTWTSNATNLCMVGCKKFYGIVPSHVESYIGGYTMYYGDANNPSSTTLSLAVSDDPSKGNVKLTAFAGISGALYGTYDSTVNGNNLVFRSAYHIPFTTDTYVFSNNSIDQNDLNFSIGYNTSSSANYGSQNWNLISWNAWIILETSSPRVSYSYMRGNKN